MNDHSLKTYVYVYIYIMCPQSCSGVLRPKSVPHPSCNKQKLHPYPYIQMYNDKSLRFKKVGKYIYNIDTRTHVSWWLRGLCLSTDLSDLVALAKQHLTLLPRPGGHQWLPPIQGVKPVAWRAACDLITRERGESRLCSPSLGNFLPIGLRLSCHDWKVLRGQSSLHTRILLASVERIRRWIQSTKGIHLLQFSLKFRFQKHESLQKFLIGHSNCISSPSVAYVVSPIINHITLFFYVFLIIFILLVNNYFMLFFPLGFPRSSSSFFLWFLPFLPIFPMFSPSFSMDLPPSQAHQQPMATSSKLQRSQVPPSMACCVASSRPPDQAHRAPSMASSAEASKPRALGSYLGRTQVGGENLGENHGKNEGKNGKKWLEVTQPMFFLGDNCGDIRGFKHQQMTHDGGFTRQNDPKWTLHQQQMEVYQQGSWRYDMIEWVYNVKIWGIMLMPQFGIAVLAICNSL